MKHDDIVWLPLSAGKTPPAVPMVNWRSERRKERVEQRHRFKGDEPRDDKYISPFF